jgi:hypothetical protein
MSLDNNKGMLGSTINMLHAKRNDRDKRNDKLMSHIWLLVSNIEGLIVSSIDRATVSFKHKFLLKHGKSSKGTKNNLSDSCSNYDGYEESTSGF